MHVAWQVLDEMVDGGFPSTTELNTLKEMIIPPSLAQRVLQSVTGEFALADNLPQGAVSKVLPNPPSRAVLQVVLVAWRELS